MIGALPTRRSVHGMLSSDDHLATSAGLGMLLAGGSAVDAAIAANAVLSVTAPHACGLGGDLLALVHHRPGAPEALVAVGRSGAGADPEALRREGHTQMPVTGDPRTVTVPGCVDGWMALHSRFGRLGLDQVLAPAIEHAAGGFWPSAELSLLSASLTGIDGAAELVGPAHAVGRERLVRRPGAARLLRGVAQDGRRAFYEGEFGSALLAMGAGAVGADDLRRDNATWTEPLGIDAFGVRLWAPPPVSQAYVALSAWWMSEALPLPDDPADPTWPHLLVEAVRQSAFDRLDVLHEGADGPALLAPERLTPRRDRISPTRASTVPDPVTTGATTYLCAVDRDGMAVSLIQSNASAFGARLVVPGTGVFLQNRGIGFSLRPGHPAEYGPRRRPPHTLSPFLLTDAAGHLRAVVGTRGADAQPQVVLQVLTRLLCHGASPAAALRGPRWLVVNEDASAPFRTWDRPSRGAVRLEDDAPSGWGEGLRERGHRVVDAAPRDGVFGSAHVISVEDGVLAGASDPRSPHGAVAGL